jgi:hypothetical protein
VEIPNRLKAADFLAATALVAERRVDFGDFRRYESIATLDTGLH